MLAVAGLPEAVEGFDADAAKIMSSLGEDPEMLADAVEQARLLVRTTERALQRPG